MENSNDTNKDLKQDQTHPVPGADPGAEIETVIPGAEKEEAQPESSGEPAEAAPEKVEPAPENTDKPDENRDTDDNDPGDKPEITEAEEDKPETKPDDHGIETISP